MFIRTIIIIIAYLAISSCFSQDNLKPKKTLDTLYIKDMSHKLAIRVYGENKFTSFDVKDNEVDSMASYSPNKNINLGFGVNYKWFGLGVAFNFPFINNDDDIYGDTKRFDLHTNIFTRKLAIDLYYSSYQGFYLENPEIYIPEWESGMPYPQRSDISTLKIGGSCTYAFKFHKYSTKAAFIQTDLQKKSAGSFLLGGFFSIFSVDGDSAFIPYELKDSYDPDLQFNHVGVLGGGVAFGYTHTFVLWKKFYISFTLVPGISYQGYDIAYEDGRAQKKGSFLAGRFQSRFALVYNSEKSFAGFTVTNDSYGGNTGKEQRSSLNYEVGVIRFFYGRRFNFPSFKTKQE